MDHPGAHGRIDESLLWVLRERLGLPGSKNACEEGECGSCTVRLDDEIVCSCLVLAASAAGRRITTIEGLAAEGELADVQQAFIDAGAVQCGFCTPGMIMRAAELLEKNPNPSEEEIRWGISGNLCRCTGYVNIVKAIQYAAEKMQKEAA